MILQDPNPILHQVCRPISWKEKKNSVHNISHLLKESYKHYQQEHPKVQVVGMAAPQVGHLLTAFYAFQEVFINPIILSRNLAKITVHEGCCSLPEDSFYDIERCNQIKLQWFTPARRLQTYNFVGSAAAIVQHELDHLRGKLITDRAKIDA